MKSYDAVVVGGGPAGLTAALYLLRSGARLAWAEEIAPGGQVLKTAEVDNYPGFRNGIKGYELADEMAAQLEGFTFDRYDAAVTSLSHEPGKNLLAVDGETIESKTVVICSGAHFRLLGLDKEEELTGRGVSYCALCDGNFYRGQVVGVVGGGNSALEESLYLANITEKVYIIHRRDEFRGSKLYQDKVMAHPKIEVVFDHVVTEILGEDEVSGVIVKNTKTGDTKQLDLAGLFIFVGFLPHTEFVPEAMAKDEYGFIITDEEMRTNLPGVFAAGDVRSKLCRQVATAVGDGATAANSAFLYLEQS